MAAVTVIPQQVRQGDHTSGSTTIPNNGSKYVRFLCVMSDTDLKDPTLSMTVTAETSKDGGTTWRNLAAMGWQGDVNAFAKDGGALPRPGFTAYIADRIGELARLIISIPVAINVGATIELLVQG